MERMTEEKALARLQALCAKAEKCSRDADTKMRQWGLDADARRRVLDSLVRDSYVDDSRYARAFASDKACFDKWGPFKVEAALRAKGLADGDISAAIACVDEERWAEAAEAVVAAKVRQLKAAGDADWRPKAVRHAMQRGFAAAVAVAIADRLGREEQ